MIRDRRYFEDLVGAAIRADEEVRGRIVEACLAAEAAGENSSVWHQAAIVGGYRERCNCHPCLSARLRGGALLSSAALSASGSGDGSHSVPVTNARRGNYDDLDRRIKAAVRDAAPANHAYLRVYVEDGFLSNIASELEARGFKNVEVPSIVLKGDVYFEWDP